MWYVLFGSVFTRMRKIATRTPFLWSIIILTFFGKFTSDNRFKLTIDQLFKLFIPALWSLGFFAEIQESCLRMCLRQPLCSLDFRLMTSLELLASLEWRENSYLRSSSRQPREGKQKHYFMIGLFLFCILFCLCPLCVTIWCVLYKKEAWKVILMFASQN